jgi:hypothetical protein
MQKKIHAAVTGEKQEYYDKDYRNAAEAARSQTEMNRNAFGASLQLVQKANGYEREERY